MELTDKIYIAGHRGMVGSGLERKLLSSGYTNIITRSSKDLDLRNQEVVNKFFELEKPDIVILAAAKVGGIHANNTYRAEFVYDNIMMEANIIHAAFMNKVKKLLFLGSSCIYPKLAPQPLKANSTPNSLKAIMIKSRIVVVMPVANTKSSGFSCCNIKYIPST